ncbi:MAG TPA: indole-3-glycerol phosphate synthase TrpC, partial [Balneolaceae bacterium]|nr:indole-3-glycerol phosphate synthase TrpC [Balneolaceae bacterium]
KQQISRVDLETLSGYERERRSLADALTAKTPVSIIAEVKKASPSEGVICQNFNPAEIARQYEKAGAAAISVLTDGPAFQGSLAHLQLASQKVDIPLLRKDFIVDPYQIKEARAYGADAILLIALITDGAQLQELQHAAREEDLECLVECYTERDLTLIDFKQTKILGVNNRNLRTFKVNVHRSIALLKKAPEGTVLVSESGINSSADINLLTKNKIDAALIGTYFMRRDEPGEALKNMINEMNKK